MYTNFSSGGVAFDYGHGQASQLNDDNPAPIETDANAAASAGTKSEALSGSADVPIPQMKSSVPSDNSTEVQPQKGAGEMNVQNKGQNQGKRGTEDSKKASKGTGNPQFPEIFYCKLCDSKCTCEFVYKQHLAGARHKKNVANAARGGPFVKPPKYKPKKHVALLSSKLASVKEPLLGLDELVEHQKEDGSLEERYVCELCQAKCDPRTVIPHLIGGKHRLAFLKKHNKEGVVAIGELKKSELTVKLLEAAKKYEAEHGRGEILVKVELNPFLGTQNQTNQVKRPGNHQAGGGKFQKTLGFDRGRGRGVGRGVGRGAERGRGGGRGHMGQVGMTGGQRHQGWTGNNQPLPLLNVGASPYIAKTSAPGRSDDLNQDYGLGNMDGRFGGPGRGRYDNKFPQQGRGGADFDVPYDNSFGGQRTESLNDRLMGESLGIQQGRQVEKRDQYGGGERYSGPSDQYGIQPDRYSGQESQYRSGMDDFTPRETPPRGSGGNLGVLLKDLSTCIVRNEEDAAMALQVSNALTQALLNYRLRNIPSEMMSGGGQSIASLMDNQHDVMDHNHGKSYM